MKTVKVELKSETFAGKNAMFFVTVNGLIVEGTFRPTREEGFAELKKITEAMMIACRYDADMSEQDNVINLIHSVEVTKDVEWAKVREAYDCAINEGIYTTGNEYYKHNG